VGQLSGKSLTCCGYLFGEKVNGEDKKNIKLKVTLKQQYVSDSLIWQDESNKSLGYQIQDGEGEFSVDLGLKKSD